MNPVDAKILIDAIQGYGHKLNSWEKKFIRDISTERIVAQRYLTDKQSQALQKIYRKSQGG